jgi:hypothetical protein
MSTENLNSNATKSPPLSSNASNERATRSSKRTRLSPWSQPVCHRLLNMTLVPDLRAWRCDMQRTCFSRSRSDRSSRATWSPTIVSERLLQSAATRVDGAGG